jgi:hypothetical protein
MEELGFPKFDYYLDESDPDIVILRRQDGSFVEVCGEWHRKVPKLGGILCRVFAPVALIGTRMEGKMSNTQRA